MRLTDFLDKGTSLGAEASCLTTAGRTLTYFDVQRLSWRVARALDRSGIAPGDKVAGTVLVNSQQLSDDDLVENAKTKSQQHLLCIAQRLKLSEAVTDVLVDRGDNKVVRTVARNRGGNDKRQPFEELAVLRHQAVPDRHDDSRIVFYATSAPPRTGTDEAPLPEANRDVTLPVTLVPKTVTSPKAKRAEAN